MCSQLTLEEAPRGRYGREGTGSLGRGRQRRDCVQKAIVLTIYQEAEVGEEVGPDEGLCDVGHHESPRELTA
jgi:hypothetical protein